MRSWLILAVVPLAFGCSKNKGAQGATDVRVQRETEIALEKCDTASKSAESIDADGDGSPEIVKVKEGGKEVCRTADLNFDGKIDRTTFFDDGAQIRRIESDYDRDGRVDELSIFEGGVLKEKHRATTMDGKLDTWEFYENGQVARTERDENGDGFIDQWWEYPNRGCPLIHVDTDGDGRPDPGASIDYCKETGYVPPPVPGEEEAAAAKKGADFGSKDTRVEETENRQAEDGELEGGADSEAGGQGTESKEGTSSDDASSDKAPEGESEATDGGEQ